MRVRSCISTVLVVMAAVFVPGRAFAQTLADRIPSDALVYVGWKGAVALKADYQKSNLKGVVDSSQVPSYVETKLKQLGEADAETGAIIKVATACAQAVWDRPVALYVGPVDLADIANPKPVLALIIDAGDGAEALVKNIKPYIEKMPEDAPKVELAREGGTVMLSIGAIDQANRGQLMGTKPGAGLGQAAAFKAAIAQVDKDAAMTVYIDAAGATSMVLDAVTKSKDAELALRLPKAIEALGLKGFTQLAMTGTFAGREWNERSFIGLKGERKGITTLIDAKPLSDGAMKLVPQDAISAQVMRLDAMAVFKEVRKVAAAIEPRAGEELDRGIEGLRKEFGIALADDVLAPLGEEWVLYRLASKDPQQKTLVLVNPLKDAKGAAATIAKLEKLARDNHMPLEDDKAALGGAQATVLKIPDVVDLAWGVVGERFVLSTPTGFEAAATHLLKKGPSLADKPSFIAARKALGGGNPLAMGYYETAKTYEEFARQIAPLLAVANLVGAELPADILPDPAKVEAFMTPGASITWVDDLGVHGQARSPFPGAAMMSGQLDSTAVVAAGSLGVAVVLPSLGRAREMSARTHDMAAARNIYKASIVYANEFNDTFPEHLAQLVANQQLSPKELVSKRAGTKPAQITDAEMKAAAKDWTKLRDKIDNACDFVYLGAGKRFAVGDESDPREIVVFEKPGPHSRDGIVVAFGDGHVEFVRAKSLPDAFKFTNELREKKKLPLVEFKDGRPVGLKK